MKLLNNIRLVREIKGYSQEYVANQLGKSQAALSKIENGQTHLSDDMIEKLSRILKVPIEKLFDDEKGLFQPLNGIATDLLNQLSVNKKLIQDIELNQDKLQTKLNLLLSKLIEKRS